jgi:dTDP-4-dehydrorhamnose reductase
MKWGVTGASGQLGSELESLLGSLGMASRCWHDGELDITKESDIDSIIEQSPDILINCAAWTAVDRAEDEELAAFRVNELGASNMAKAAQKLNIPLVHISTDYVFSGEGEKPWRVSDQTQPMSAYGRSKLAGEISVQSIHGDRSYILRTAWLYSEHGSNFPKSIMKRALQSEDSLNVVVDQIGQPTSAKDLAMQIVRIVENELPFGIYHATNSGKTSWFDFARRILMLMGQSVDRVVAVPSSAYPSRVQRPAFSVLDHSEWLTTKVAPMRDWQLAFDEVFPSILKKVEAELLHG